MEVETLGELLHKLEEWRKEDKKWAFAEKFETRALISWGFSLAMVGISVTNYRLSNILVTIAFFVIGIILFMISLIIKKRINKK